jgi:tRNA dimethylallyltransferase
MTLKIPKKTLLLAGPTASGKSALALRLAAGMQMATGVQSTIINADSMQVYQDLRVLSARPDADEENICPHKLFGHVDGAINYSVGEYLREIAPVLHTIHTQGQHAIIVGGTGLYFKALTQGMSEIPPVADTIRENVRAQCAGRPAQDLHTELARLDPLAASRLRPTDPQRIIRALEVFIATGRSIVAFQGQRTRPLLHNWTGVFLHPERTALNMRIANRFTAMMQTGAWQEVEKLAARALSPSLPIMRAHGVPHLLCALRGECRIEEAIARSILDTQHYAKRQITFARRQLPEFIPCPVGEDVVWE